MFREVAVQNSIRKEDQRGCAMAGSAIDRHRGTAVAMSCRASLFHDFGAGTLKIGEQITVEGFRAKSEAMTAAPRMVELPGGK
jgi:hypothetical protein